MDCGGIASVSGADHLRMLRRRSGASNPDLRVSWLGPIEESCGTARNSDHATEARSGARATFRYSGRDKEETMSGANTNSAGARRPLPKAASGKAAKRTAARAVPEDIRRNTYTQERPFVLPARVLRKRG